ncbi:MAG: pilus assembly protein [Pontixanthobacter sp.]
MSEGHNNAGKKWHGGFLRRLARDRSGNTLALIAAAIFPMLGLVGSGIDMGRAYLASSKLQNACDAGVLAARKSLGTQPIVSGNVPANVASTGMRFFNLNFQNGNFGTENRSFTMTLEQDFAITGAASVDVPTTIMSVFGYDRVPISVDCSAVLSVSELDVMMVLDVTGSMRHANDGDAMSRMDSMKQVIRNFHAQLEGSKAPTSKIRYGFVPYASNVNVGGLLEDDWVTDEWTYQSRETSAINQSTYNAAFTRNWVYKSGSVTNWIDESSYAATFVEGTPPSGVGTDTGSAGTSGYYTCSGGQPANTFTLSDVLNNTVTESVTNPDGIRTIEYFTRTENGKVYNTYISGQTCTVRSRIYSSLINDFEKVTEPRYSNTSEYTYQPISSDVTNWRSESSGCIEERSTYIIDDYSNVDLAKALDLNIDLVPTAGMADTQWRPSYANKIFARKFFWDGNGSFSVNPVTTTDNYADVGNWWFSDCPAPAQKLQEMTTADVDTYLATLEPYGSTYHDIGMIWGARLLSPTGLYASENADVAGSPKTRHLIFLTDGQTEPYDLAYGAYGVEGLDERRWTPSSPMTLAETVEARFSVACTEAKKRNITVWVIAFGTYLNDSMADCAGSGRYFEAANAADLNNAFSSIAKSIGDLRIEQ